MSTFQLWQALAYKAEINIKKVQSMLYRVINAQIQILDYIIELSVYNSMSLKRVTLNVISATIQPMIIL